jgi:hypothetical protein
MFLKLLFKRFASLFFMMALLCFSASLVVAQCSAPEDDSEFNSEDAFADTTWNMYVIFNDTEYHNEGQADISYLLNSGYTDCSCGTHGSYHSAADTYEFAAYGPNAPCSWNLYWDFYGPLQVLAGCTSGSCQSTGKVANIEADAGYYGSYSAMDSPY